MKVEDKLAFFKDFVFQEAEEQKQAQNLELEEKLRSAEETVRADEQRKSDDRVELERIKAEHSRNTALISCISAAKGEVTALRSSIIEDIFDRARQKLDDFTQSPEYAGYLSDKIKKSVNIKEDIEILLRPVDMKHAGKIEKECGVRVSRADADDYIGGFVVYFPKKRAMLDMTFKTRFGEERSEFNQNEYIKG